MKGPADQSRVRSARNGVLLAAAFLLAGYTAAKLIDATWLTPSPERSAARPSSPAASELSGADRPAISDRDPASSALQPEPRQEIGPSQLPLVLLGTFAASDPSLSRATLRHRESQETVVVRVGDEIEGRARVVEIERERVLLREDGSLRELRLDGERAPSDAGAATPDAGVATSEESETPAPSPPAESPFEMWVTDLERSLLDSTGGQARVAPEVEGEQLVGLRFSEIQEGSRFAQMGIQEDDVITQFNGISIDSPFVALHVVRQMLEASRYKVMVRRGGTLTEFSGQRDDAGS